MSKSLCKRFSDAASVLGGFCPADDAKKADIDGMRALYGRWFALVFVQYQEDEYIKRGSEPARATYALKYGEQALKAADEVSRFANEKYWRWFNANVKDHWDYGYVKKVGEALFECAYETQAGRSRKQGWRRPKDFKARLAAEANRFKNQEAWRGDKPELAAHFEECFRILPEPFPDLPRGQQRSFEPNSRLIHQFMELGGEETREGLTTPGDKFDQPSGEQPRGGTPSPGRKSLIDKVKAQAEHFSAMGVTPDGLRKAFKSLDRRRQRSRPKHADD